MSTGPTLGRWDLMHVNILAEVIIYRTLAVFRLFFHTYKGGDLGPFEPLSCSPTAHLLISPPRSSHRKPFDRGEAGLPVQQIPSRGNSSDQDTGKKQNCRKKRATEEKERAMICGHHLQKHSLFGACVVVAFQCTCRQFHLHQS